MRGAFIGRERELADMMVALDGAVEGQGAVFLLAGEPGIGKTRLAEAVASSAAERGARVAWARSWEGGEAAPYWMWAQVIRSLIDGVEEETLRSALVPGTERLALLAPEFAEWSGTTATPVEAIDSDAGRFYLFESTARFLKQLSSTAPLVLVLDDVLAGDQPSLMLLRFLARDVRSLPILILGTYRGAEATPSGDSIDVLADLVREGSGLDLRGLDERDVGRLIAEVSGLEPVPSKVAAIHEATGGNPLFVREVTRLLMTMDPLDQPGRLCVPVPDTVRAVIHRRLAPLPADAIQVLSAAAVVGRHFDLALVDAACDLPTNAIAASLSEAMSLGVVTNADAARRYRFTHPLMREAIYEGLPLPARTDMHQRVGIAIERLHGSDTTSRLGELAYHFSKAVPLGEGAKAQQYATRAGDRAMCSSAYEQAVVQYKRALDAVALTGDADPRGRCDLLLRLGRAQTRIGEYQHSKATFLLASDLAREFGTSQQLGWAALGYGEPQVEGGLVDRQLIRLLEEAIDRLPSEDSPLRVKLLARLSLELTFEDLKSLRESRRQSLSLEALEMARRLDDVGALVSALRARWLARWGPDGLEERRSLCDEGLTLALETGDRDVELFARARRATCSLEAGDIAAADLDIVAHTRVAEDLRMPYHEWAAATMRAGQALLSGSLDQVEALAQDALDRMPGRPNALHAHVNQLTVLRWEQGRLGEMHETWQELVERFPQLGFVRGWLCLATADIGREEAARRQLRELAEAIPRLPHNGIWLPAIALASLAAARFEDAAAAAILYPLLQPYADRMIVISMPHPAICFGSASLYLGLLATELGRWDEAEAHFEAAANENQRLGSRPLFARSQHSHARMLVQRGHDGDQGRAVELLDSVEALAGAMGMARLMADVDSLRERAAGADDPVAVRAEDGPHVFRREGEYWTIVHDGEVVRLRDTKGLRCLARLLADPGREFPAVELEAWESEASAPALVGAAQMSRSSGVNGVRPDLGDAGALLDEQAKAEYRSRIEELRAEIDEAESFNDPGRATRAQEELEFLTSELARAVGLGGRDRRASSHAERARLNVTRAIRSSMRALERDHPALAEHLSATVRTGRYCSYTPDPRAPIDWEI